MTSDDTVPTVTAPSACNVVVDREANRVFIDIDYLIGDLDAYLTADEGYAAQLADSEWIAENVAQRKLIDFLKISALSLHDQNGV